MAKTCVYFENPYGTFHSGLDKPCGKPAVAEGPQGYLCKEHKREEDLYRRDGRQPKIQVIEIDCAKIVAAEKAILKTVTRRKVRFGIVEPIFLTYAE